MASKPAIRRCFACLTQCAFPEPEAWRGVGEEERAELVSSSVATYSYVLHDLTDEEVLAATVAFVRSEARWWPTPGQLLACFDACYPGVRRDRAYERWMQEELRLALDSSSQAEAPRITMNSGSSQGEGKTSQR